MESWDRDQLQRLWQGQQAAHAQTVVSWQVSHKAQGGLRARCVKGGGGGLGEGWGGDCRGWGSVGGVPSWTGWSPGTHFASGVVGCLGRGQRQVRVWHQAELPGSVQALLRKSNLS